MSDVHFPMVRQIVASVDDQTAGPSYSVAALSGALRARGLESVIMAVGYRAHKPGLEVFSHDMKRLPVANRLMMSRGLARALDSAAEQGAVLHGHGLWLMPNVYPARAARRHGVPLIMAPRGMLGKEAMAFSATRKRVVWALEQRRALEIVRCFHATSNTERDDIRRAGLSAPVAVIPNGIHVPDGEPAPGARTILQLGRLHPKKGIDRLIDGWAQVADAHPNWRLRIVGPSEIGYRAELERQVQAGQVPRVDFDDPLFGDAKWDAYTQAGLFVLPTLNENFGLVVAEALAAGVPTICTKGAPWRGLETERCGWWVDHGPDEMAAALDAALSLPDEARAEMGARGRAWMQRDFSWDDIAARMAQLYDWCLGRGDRPDCVTK